MRGGPSDEDLRFMEQALALAALGEGRASPNPRVGCLLVRDGQVVGRGYHEFPGAPHAEARAAERAGPMAKGATAYVTLEPCAHFGRTPPCSDLLVEIGVRRVVAAAADPNPLVRGRGFARLRAAGIEVEVGCLEREARRLNAPFFSIHERGRPFVTLKAAASLDGMISAAGGRSRWVSGEPARRFAHRLRFARDAVLVGADTVRRDDPELSVRLPGLRASRLRVVLSRELSVSVRSRLFEPQAEGERLPRVYVSEAVGPERAAGFAGRAEIVRVPERGDGLDLERVLADLLSVGVQSVLVEGGGRTLASFLESGLADELFLFVAPKLFGGSGGTPLLSARAVTEPAAAYGLAEIRRIPLGEDLLWIGTVRPRDPRGRSS